QTIELPLPTGAPSGLRLRAFELGREAPRFVPAPAAEPAGAVIGLELEVATRSGRLVFAPGVPTIGKTLREAAARADCLLIDGTFWSDDEPVSMGITSSTARQMGHVPVSGA